MSEFGSDDRVGHQMVAISSTNAMAKQDLQGNRPAANAMPSVDGSVPRKLNESDHRMATFAGSEWYVIIDDSRDGVNCVMEAVNEFKHESTISNAGIWACSWFRCS